MEQEQAWRGHGVSLGSVAVKTGRMEEPDHSKGLTYLPQKRRPVETDLPTPFPILIYLFFLCFLRWEEEEERAPACCSVGSVWLLLLALLVVLFHCVTCLINMSLIFFERQGKMATCVPLNEPHSKNRHVFLSHHAPAVSLWHDFLA